MTENNHQIINNFSMNDIITELANNQAINVISLAECQAMLTNKMPDGLYDKLINVFHQTALAYAPENQRAEIEAQFSSTDDVWGEEYFTELRNAVFFKLTEINQRINGTYELAD